ncbi:MAG: hypothetical protein J0I43_08690 [Microbacterium sp.]|uniref:hypothetical protein n=1 Tax=Microbacterium sp. TaxID=51671 RepID=UPI001ACE8151|nr:hypothetical protein [Microbacterium sp.]MBN9177425.1 hypothetical protein [Microbacterium sp.]
MVSLIDSPLLEALDAARRHVHRAQQSAVRVRTRVGALADATDWRSRATERYRTGLADLDGGCARLADLLRGAEAALDDAARREGIRIAQVYGSVP